MVERLLHWYGQIHGLAWVALRYFNAAGADPDGELGENHDPETHLIPRTILAALGRVPCLQIFGTDYDTPDGTAHSRLFARHRPGGSAFGRSEIPGLGRSQHPV